MFFVIRVEGTLRVGSAGRQTAERVGKPRRHARQVVVGQHPRSLRCDQESVLVLGRESQTRPRGVDQCAKYACRGRLSAAPLALKDEKGEWSARLQGVQQPGQSKPPAPLV